MNLSSKHIFYAFISLLLIAILVWMFAGRSAFSWKENFQEKSKEPYGLYAIHQLLGNYTDAAELIELKDSIVGELPMDSLQKSNYVFIGQGIYMRPEDRNALLDFVELGNTAFIAARVLPYDLMFHLYYDECEASPWTGFHAIRDTSVHLNFEDPVLHQTTDYNFTYINAFKAAETDWGYFYDDYFCGLENGFISLAYGHDEFSNMVMVPYGDGYFILHSQPQLFTNFFTVKKDGKSHAEQAFSYLNEGAVYWDKYSRIGEYLAHNRNNRYAGNQLSTQSPLQYILNQPSLAWAWYILLFLGLIFLIFRAKRRQRPIPVKVPVENTSLQFLKTIAWLSFQKSSHQHIAIEAIKIFRTHVKERYHLAWNEEDPRFVEQLSRRSGIAEDKVAYIIKKAKVIPTYTGLVGTELIHFHQSLEHFYQHAK